MFTISNHTRWMLPFLAAGLLACGGENGENQGEENQENYGEVVDLSGAWVALGYDCEADFDAAELVDVEISDNDFVAVKIVGDDCVPAGMETLRAELPAEVREGMSIDAEIQVVDGTGFSWEDTTIEVVSGDEFLLPAATLTDLDRDIRFLRTSTDGLDEVDISGEWQGWGYACNSPTRMTQTIDFAVDGDDVTATKVTGDDCIGAGEVTWEGARDGAEMSGEIFGTDGSDPATFEILARDFMLLTVDGTTEVFHFWRTP